MSQHVRQENTPDGGISALGRGGYTVLPFYTTTTGTVTTTTQNAATHALAAAINSAPAIDRSNYYGFADDREEVEADMVTFKFEHDLGAQHRDSQYHAHGQDGHRARTERRQLACGEREYHEPGQRGLSRIRAIGSQWTFTPSRQRIDQVDEIVINQTSFNSSVRLREDQSLADRRTGVHRRTAQVADVRHRGSHHQRRDLRGDREPGDELLRPRSERRARQPYPTGAFTDGETTTAALYLVRFGRAESGSGC